MSDKATEAKRRIEALLDDVKVSGQAPKFFEDPRAFALRHKLSLPDEEIKELKRSQPKDVEELRRRLSALGPSLVHW